MSQNNMLGQTLVVKTQHSHLLSAKPIGLLFRLTGLAQHTQAQCILMLLVMCFLRFPEPEDAGKREDKDLGVE